MCEFLQGVFLGPSPNWYMTRISACNADGIFVYGSRNFVVTLDIRSNPPVYKHVQIVHKEKVTTLAFNYADSNILATGSEDGTLKVWNITNWTVSYEYTSLQKVICIEWQYMNNSALFVLDNSGSILLWDFQKCTTTPMVHGLKKKPLIALSNPQNASQLIVGFKDGLIGILDVSKKGQVLMKLKGHDDEVLSLSWNCFSNITSGVEREESIWQLASTGRDKSLRVWDIEQEKCAVFKIPQGARHKDDTKGRMWLVSSWVHSSSHYNLICSTFLGELMYVTLMPDGKPKYESFDVKTVGGHSRCIFNISVVQDTAISISLDRMIVVWNVKEKKSSCVLPTLGGFVYSLAFSSIIIGKLAVGVGDSTIRIWNVASSISPYHCTCLWQGIRGKVLTLAWHPEKENWLAFGTEEGRVGIADVTSSKQPIISSTYHRNSVYSLSWGPCKKLEGTKVQWFLYSCGDGKILVHNPSEPQADALDFRDFLSTKRPTSQCSAFSEIAWKPDFISLAVGYEDGNVEIYSQHFVLLAQLMAQKKLIQCLRWHPSCVTVASERSCLDGWLACASNEPVVHVYNLQDIVYENEKEVRVVSQSTRQLNAHTLRVVSLSWNPHQEGFLASASYDSSVQIWNVMTGEPIANYRGHQGRVFCVDWNPLNPDSIFSGSEDSTVQQFLISETQHRLPVSNKKEKKKKIKKNLDNKSNQMQVKENANIISEEIQQLLLKKENELKEDSLRSHDSNNLLLEVDTAEVIDGKRDDEHRNSTFSVKSAEVESLSVSSTSASQYIKSARSGSSGETRKKKKTTKSMFPLMSALDSRGKAYGLEDCKHLVNIEGGCLSADAENKHLCFFMDNAAFTKMLATEEMHHIKEKNFEYAFQMRLWMGDVGDALREAAGKGQLTDNLVSVAPLASRALWLEMCEKYAQQLIAEDMFHKAAFYLITCHKIYDAIALFKDHGLYREAISVARLRLPETDSVLKQLMLDWATKNEKEGNFEMAAKCYLNQRQFSAASKALAKRNNPESFQSAAYIAAKEGLKAECEGYVLSCFQSALIHDEWDIIDQMVNEQLQFELIPGISVFIQVVHLHKNLVLFFEECKQIQKTAPLEQMLLKNVPSSVHLWHGYLLKKRSFFWKVEKEWNDHELLPPTSADVQNDCCQLLAKLSTCKQHAGNIKEMLYQLAVELTLYMLHPVTQLAEVLHKAYLSGLDIFQNVCVLVFPLDHIWMKEQTHPEEPLKFRTDPEDKWLNLMEQMISTFSDVTLPFWLKDSFSEQKGELISGVISEVNDNLMLCLKAFYATALLENLQRELDSLEIITHVQHDDIALCLSEGCESIRKGLLRVLTLICCHLLNDDQAELAFLKCKLSAIETKLAAAFVQKSSGKEDFADVSDELQKERHQILERIDEISTQTGQLPFPNPKESAIKCITFCDDISRQVDCPFFKSTFTEMRKNIALWMQDYVFEDLQKTLLQTV